METTLKKKKRKNTSVNLLKSLSIAKNEKDVENAYRSAFESLFPGCISSPNKTDGIFTTEDIYALMEFKYDLDFRAKSQQVIPIIQSLFYLKRLSTLGKAMPKVIFVGDANECFCMPTKNITKYLNEDIDWNTAPSTAAKTYPLLVVKMTQDVDINPFIYDVNETFDFLMLIEKMRKISQNQPYAVSITKNNIVEIFRRFDSDVVTDRNLNKAMLFPEDEKKRMLLFVDTFFTCLTAPNEAYLHPKKKNTLVVRGVERSVHADNYRAFISQFKMEYTPKELEDLTANKDRVLEDLYRRTTGAFFTPEIWAEEARKMIGEALGDNWKDEYVVWDCAAGSGNLTRGAKFAELYISTLEETDINTIKDCKYNPEAKEVFRYDFLNNLGLSNVPDSLKKAFEDGKKILFFINPPYGTAKHYDIKGGSSKDGIAETLVWKNMKNIGAASQQLYAQFMYKIASFQQAFPGQIHLCLFAPPLFVSGPAFRDFRVMFCRHFAFKNGMLFAASNFTDVAKNWGISFTIWAPGTNDAHMQISLKTKEVNKEIYAIETSGDKIIVSTNGNSASTWAKKESKAEKTYDAPQMTSAIGVKQEGRGVIVNGALGYMHNNGNNTYHNQTLVGLYSSAFSGSNGFSILAANFRKVVALFTARKTIIRDWNNFQDEYMIPNTSHPDYEQWNNDAIIYALFNSHSNQSSLRKIVYKGKEWNIFNSFFFMSNTEMQTLANDNSYTDMYVDAKAYPDERYVYTLLQSTTLSVDAKAVLEAARELVRKSMAMRKLYAEDNKQYNLQSWDSSYAQLRNLWKTYYAEDFKAFRDLYKALESRLRLGVYEFGFLKM